MKDVFKSPYHAIWNLCNEYKEVQVAAQNYLLECGEDAIKPLMNALWYPEQYVIDPFLRRGILGYHHPFIVRESLHILLRRKPIADTLTMLGRSSIPYLISTLFHGEEYFLREWVANILSRIGDSRATIPILVAMLEERNTLTLPYSDPETALYLTIRPFRPFQWRWESEESFTFGDMLDYFIADHNINPEDIGNYSQEHLLSLLPSSILPIDMKPHYEKIIEDAMSNKISIDDMGTHIENCLTLSDELRPIYVLTVMHHNNFNLKEALAHYDANRHLHTSG